MRNCTHFSHPTDEQLRLLNISSNNNLPSVQFEFWRSWQYGNDDGYGNGDGDSNGSYKENPAGNQNRPTKSRFFYLVCVQGPDGVLTKTLEISLVRFQNRSGQFEMLSVSSPYPSSKTQG